MDPADGISGTEWWPYLFQGSIAALLGLVGVFFAFRLTARHDRTMQTARVEADDARALRERTAQSVASVVEAAHRLRGLGGELNQAQQIDGLCSALVLFSVREAQDHPLVAMWASKESTELSQMFVQKEDIRAPTWEAAMIATLLTHWSASGFTSDDLFAPRATSQDEGARPEPDTGDGGSPVSEAGG